MSFYRDCMIAATRKPHRCAGCTRVIEAKSPAFYLACMGSAFDGVWYGHYHPDCRNAEVALNELHDVRHGDDWVPLSDAEDDDHDWLLAEYPAVFARMFPASVPA